jgi:DNA-binding response OmpR family regulator
MEMTRANALSGNRILIVEDDYYLATDAAQALKDAGAEVIGPCPTEDAARAQLARSLATAAVLDINLRNLRSFALARELRQQNVPFVFVTGYDEDVIPPEFEGIRRLQKPVEVRQLVSALAEALDVTSDVSRPVR